MAGTIGNGFWTGECYACKTQITRRNSLATLDDKANKLAGGKYQRRCRDGKACAERANPNKETKPE